MNNSTNKTNIAVYIFMFAGVLLAAAQTVSDLFFYDSDVFLYKHGALLPFVLNFILIIYTIAAIVFFGMKAKTLTDSYPPASSSEKIITVLTGIALLATGISDIVVLMKKRSELMYIPSRQDTFILWSGILSVAAFLYFIIAAFISKEGQTPKVLLGCVVIIWHIMHILAIYFDMTNPLNNPLRLMNEFALVAGMLFITAEIRFLIKTPKKGFYIAVSLIAFTLLMTSAASGFFCAIFGLIPINSALIARCYEFLLAIYIEGRLLSYIRQEVPEKVWDADGSPQNGI